MRKEYELVHTNNSYVKQTSDESGNPLPLMQGDKEDHTHVVNTEVYASETSQHQVSYYKEDGIISLLAPIIHVQKPSE